MWDDEDQDIYHDYGSYESDVLSPILDISAVTTPYLKFSQKRTDFSFSDVSDELYVYYRSTAAGEDSTWFLLAQLFQKKFFQGFFDMYDLASC